MIGQRDYSKDYILGGDGCIFPYLNWSLIGGNEEGTGIDFLGDGTEDNIPEWLIPSWDNIKFVFNM